MTGTMLRTALLGLAALVAASLSASAASVSGRCRVPDVLLTFDRELVRTERLVDRSSPVRVLVVGPRIGGPSLSAVKRGRLEMELARRLPDVSFSIIDEGAATGLVRDDFERIRAGIERHAPDLVIWQLGIGDALARTNLSEFSHTLERAAGWLRGRDIDLILIDPPFVPRVRYEHAYGLIVNQIKAVSDREKVNVLRQYAATNHLYGQSLRDDLGGDGPRACLPELVAEAMVRAVTR